MLYTEENGTPLPTNPAMLSVTRNNLMFNDIKLLKQVLQFNPLAETIEKLQLLVNKRWFQIITSDDFVQEIITTQFYRSRSTCFTPISLLDNTGKYERLINKLTYLSYFKTISFNKLKNHSIKFSIYKENQIAGEHRCFQPVGSRTTLKLIDANLIFNNNKDTDEQVAIVLTIDRVDNESDQITEKIQNIFVRDRGVIVSYLPCSEDLSHLYLNHNSKRNQIHFFNKKLTIQNLGKNEELSRFSTQFSWDLESNVFYRVITFSRNSFTLITDSKEYSCFSPCFNPKNSLSLLENYIDKGYRFFFKQLMCDNLAIHFSHQSILTILTCKEIGRILFLHPPILTSFLINSGVLLPEDFNFELKSGACKVMVCLLFQSSETIDLFAQLLHKDLSIDDFFHQILWKYDRDTLTEHLQNLWEIPKEQLLINLDAFIKGLIRYKLLSSLEICAQSFLSKIVLKNWSKEYTELIDESPDFIYLLVRKFFTEYPLDCPKFEKNEIDYLKAFFLNINHVHTYRAKSFVELLVLNPSPFSSSVIQKFINQKHPPSLLCYEFAIRFFQNDLLTFFTSVSDQTFINSHIYTLLSMISVSNNWKAVGILFTDREIDIKLTNLIADNQLTPEIVIELASCEFTIDDQEEYNKVLEWALRCYDIKLIKALLKTIAGKGIKQKNQTLTIDSAEDKTLFLQHYLLYSEISEIYDLVKNNKDTLKIFNQLVSKIAYTVRLPIKHKSVILEKKLNSVIHTQKQNYVNRTWEYIEQNIQLKDRILNLLEEESLTWNELLEIIAFDRLQRFTGEETAYQIKEFLSEFKPPNEKNFTLKDLNKLDEIHPKARYYCFNNVLLQTLFQTDFLDQEEFRQGSNQYNSSIYYYLKTRNKENTGLSPNKSNISYTNKKNYYFYYHSSRKKKQIPMTCIAFTFSPESKKIHIGKWVHTSYNSKLETDEEVESIFQEILLYRKKEEYNPTTLQQLIAKFYWLIATRVDMLRGTPHISMMILNILQEYCNLPVLIPKFRNEHTYSYFIDNQALMTPIDDFIEHFDELFEKW